MPLGRVSQADRFESGPDSWGTVRPRRMSRRMPARTTRRLPSAGCCPSIPNFWGSSSQSPPSAAGRCLSGTFFWVPSFRRSDPSEARLLARLASCEAAQAGFSHARFAARHVSSVSPVSGVSRVSRYPNESCVSLVSERSRYPLSRVSQWAAAAGCSPVRRGSFRWLYQGVPWQGSAMHGFCLSGGVSPHPFFALPGPRFAELLARSPVPARFFARVRDPEQIVFSRSGRSFASSG